MFTEVPYVPQYIVSAYQVVRQIIEKNLCSTEN